MILSRKISLVFLLGLFVTIYVGCKGNAVTTPGSVDSVLVQLHDASMKAQLEDQFANYELKEQKKVSKPMQIYLFSFNTDKIKDTDLVKLLKESNLVKEAQTNKDLTTREH